MKFKTLLWSSVALALVTGSGMCKLSDKMGTLTLAIRQCSRGYADGSRDEKELDRCPKTDSGVDYKNHSYNNNNDASDLF